MFLSFQNYIRKNRFVVMTFLFFSMDIGYYFWLRSFNLSKESALFETITSFILLLFFSFILQRIHTFYHSRSAINIVHLGIIFVFSFLTNLFIHEYGSWFRVNDSNYLSYLEIAFYLRWFVLFLILLTVVNQLWIVKHLLEQNLNLNRLVEKERELVRAEISGIQEQMRPHFLFNSLNSISALVKKQPDQAREMIFQLSDLLRLSMGKSKEELCSLKEELDYLNLYLAIEKVRFGHRLEIDITPFENPQEYTVPSLILQPLVENAIKYGLYGQTEDLCIKISIDILGSNLIITIENPFDETSNNSNKGNGFGLSSVRRKLELIYQRTDLMEIENMNNTFKVKLVIPQ